jgi:peptide/nickel transport system ATP-binding protein
MSGASPLVVQGLTVVTAHGVPIVNDLDLEISEPQVYAIVGESGSGKTTAGLAMLGHGRAGARIAAGTVSIEGTPITGQTDARVRQLRGRLVSYVPQDPSTALNPGMRVGAQMTAMLHAHRPDERPDTAIAGMFERVGLPGTPSFLRRYPHQLSGGQQQRVAIAIALVCRPRLVVLDEPTTALDVVTQRLILNELRRLRDELGVTMLYISHDLAVVAELADSIGVFYAGRLVETGTAAELLGNPRHPYTRALLEAVPDHAQPRQLQGIPGTMASLNNLPPGCPFAPRCTQRADHCTERPPALEDIGAGHRVACYEQARTSAPVVRPATRRQPDTAVEVPALSVVGLQAHHRTRDGMVHVCRDISFDISARTTLALVGESGSGKTTAARSVVGLHPRTGGQVLLAGEELAAQVGRRTSDQRRRLQMVFQNPYASLNPTVTVGDSIARPAELFFGMSHTDALRKARDLADLVRLPDRVLDRYPVELSGGERQRAAIARALIAEPEVLVCDEITSALDVSVQAAVIELLEDLRQQLNLSMLFISHDLGVVASIADRIVVLEQGQIREQGDIGEVLAHPDNDYTRRLVDAVPRVPTGHDANLEQAHEDH